jgi:uncharacterized protein involved in exopolysaccharide biosynthesis
VTPGPVDDYLRRLARELRQRGLDDERTVEEAREHLVDAVEDGRQRGLSVEEAEREAFERFGAPEIVAAHVAPERDRMMGRFAVVLETVWHRKWWILAPTVLTAVVTSVASYYFLPTRYRSDSIIRIVSQRLPEWVLPTATDRSGVRVQHISQMVLSRTRLEMIIREFGLYQAERERAPLDALVLQMRRDISVTFLTSDQAQGDDVGGFNVSFVSSDPNMAQKITARLTALFVEENSRDRVTEVDGFTQFIDSQIDDLQSRIIAYEKTLEDLRAQNGRRPLSQADLLSYEVLQERYKALLIKREESRMAAGIERRQIGDQFRIVDPPRLPERPVGPSRLSVNLAGTFAGLGLGLAFVGVRGRSKNDTNDTNDQNE